jgi:hypothetical protein
LIGVGNQHLAPSPSSALPPPLVSLGGCTSMHFGENQLSPRSVGISPLSTSHPPVLQHWWVRASTDFHIRFTLLMDSSRGFGSHRRHWPRVSPRLRPLQTRFPSGSPPLAEVNPRDGDALAGSFYKRHAISPWWDVPTVASDCWKGRGFRVSFIPLSGCFSPFPHGTGSLSVAVGIEPWRVVPPASHKLTGVRGTQDPSRSALPWRLRDSHPLWWCLPAPSPSVFALVVLVLQPLRAAERPTGLGSSHFARHYFGNLA